MALEDPQILQNIQIQLQITGAPQIGNTYAATLHYQMAYRVQNHAMDLSIPKDTDDALLIQMESQHSPSCIHIPRQIPKNELIKLLPESWVTNYEKQHENTTPIQSVESTIDRNTDGTVEISFKKEPSEKPRPSIFSTQINLITTLDVPTKPQDIYLEGVTVESFNSLGDPIYTFADESGHKFFDVCDCHKCLMTSSDEDDTPKGKKGKKKSIQQELKESYEAGDPEVGLLGEPSGKSFEYYVRYPRGKSPPSGRELPNCYMFGPSTSKEEDFPPFEFEKENSTHSWKIKNPIIKNPDGSTRQISAAEATLNWQSENAQIQNSFLKRIDKKVTVMDHAIKEINQKISSLHHELLNLATTVSITSPIMLEKESELKSLKTQLHSLQNKPTSPSHMPYDIFTPYPIYTTPSLMTNPQPIPPLPHDPCPFGASSFLPTRVLEEQHVTKKR